MISPLPAALLPRCPPAESLGPCGPTLRFFFSACFFSAFVMRVCLVCFSACLCFSDYQFRRV